MGDENAISYTWSDVDSKVIDKLNQIKEKGGKLRILSKTIISPSTSAVINDFIEKFAKTDGSPENELGADIKHVQYDAQSYYGIRKANQANFQSDFIPSYNFDKAKVILSVNADFIANWLIPLNFLMIMLRTENQKMAGCPSIFILNLFYP